MNPITQQPWALSEATRKKVALILRPDRFAVNTVFIVAQIDAAAADYRRRLNLGEEILDTRGPSYSRAVSLAKRGNRFALSALALKPPPGRRRPRLTREKPALVFALARLWPNRITPSPKVNFRAGLTLSPKSPFVRVLGIVLADCGTPSENPYKLARRINKEGMPPVYRVEPMTLESFRL